jgi:hypothetical protein
MELNFKFLLTAGSDILSTEVFLFSSWGKFKYKKKLKSNNSQNKFKIFRFTVRDVGVIKALVR